MASTPLRLWNTAHNHIDVLSAARPSCFAALTAGYLSTHVHSLSYLRESETKSYIPRLDLLRYIPSREEVE